jgi:hypothetical protein
LPRSGDLFRGGAISPHHNAFAAYFTPRVRAAAKAQRTTLSIILRGCIGYIQPLDVSLNKPMKALIKEEHDNHYNRYIEE